MRLFTYSILLQLGHMIPSMAQMSESIEVMTEMLTAASNLENVVESFKSQFQNHQPICMNPTENYVKCINVPDNIDKTAFLVHPVAPPGTTLEMLKGTDDYEMAKQMIGTFRSSLSECNKVGKYGLAIYRWLSSSDHTTKITATSLVTDFMGPAGWGEGNGANGEEERYICGSGPIHETTIIQFLAQKEIDASFKMMRAANSLDKVVESFQLHFDDHQPLCADPKENYVKCMSIEDDIDETTFLVHPIAPAGMKLGMLKGTPDYVMGKDMIVSFRNAIDSCDETSKFGLAAYPWLSALDHVTMIGATSLVTDFMGPADYGTRRLAGGESLDRYMCGSGPLVEEDIIEDTPLDQQDLKPNSIFSAVFNTLRATRNLDNAIERLKLDLDNEQPVCMHPTLNYVKCITTPKDIDETIFIVHPVTPAGTTLKDLEGTSDYKMVREMIKSFRSAVNGCDEVGKYGLATYPWIEESDESPMITGVSLVKDFMGPVNWGERRLSGKNFVDTGFTRKDQGMERYVCGTGPLIEESLIDSLQLDIEDAVMEGIELDVEEAIEEAVGPIVEKPPLDSIKPAIEESIIKNERDSGPVTEITFMEDAKSTEKTEAPTPVNSSAPNLNSFVSAFSISALAFSLFFITL